MPAKIGTPQAWVEHAETCYPDSEPVSAEEHSEAVRVAAAVLEWAKSEIGRAPRPPREA